MPRFAVRATTAIAAIVLTGVAFPVMAAASTASASPAGASTDIAPVVVPATSTGDAVRVTGGQVIAPAAGSSVSLLVERVDGPSTVQVVSTDVRGVVTIDDGVTANAVADKASTKCSDSAYSFLNGARWNSTYEWRYRTSTTPDGLSQGQTVRALRSAVGNITSSHNDCGFADEVGATARYLGVTTLPSDVTAEGGCGGPSGQNVTEFGDLKDNGVLAITCVYSAGPNIVAASIRINTDFGWRIKGACTSAYSIGATMTHEFGHAFGLGHVDESAHGDLTMSSGINASCSNFESHLGRGDVLALRSLY